MLSTSKGSIPPRVFLYWATGFDNAPQVVQTAVHSWRQRSGLEVVLLNQENLAEWIELDQILPGWQNLPIQIQADVIRLQLLHSHAGFWADATVLCSESFAEWLDTCPPRVTLMPWVPESTDKFFDTFFIGAPQNSRFIRIWRNGLLRCLQNLPERMSSQKTKRLLKVLPVLRTKLGRALFTHQWFIRRFGVPYFIVHYAGTRALISSPTGWRAFFTTPRWRPGKFSQLLKTEDPIAAYHEANRLGIFPLWKLTHKPLPDQKKQLDDILADYWAHHDSR